MIEAALLLSALVGDWTDLGIISALLLANAVVGFWEEYQAGNAIAALKARLALEARAERDGKWQVLSARELVPGDRLRLRLGDIVPADAELGAGDPVHVDQSALTGESLPVTRKTGEVVYSGSIVGQGEIEAVVTKTGKDTYFGKIAQLVETAHAASHFQRAVLKIGDYLIVIAVALVVLIVTVALFRGDPMLTTLEFALILTVASIPVAMPTVLSVTMAVGARLLARKEAIVSRLAAIEELAGLDVLRSDKTGTLTQNELTLGTPFAAEGVKPDEVIRAAALASRAENKDAIDQAVLGGVAEANALRGFRSLGVARAEGDGPWQLLGVLPLFDPPREDSRATIDTARQMGVAVKMVTGDQLAIGRETACELGLGTNMLDAAAFADSAASSDGQLTDIVEGADGFVQVFPEHKYRIVELLQKRGHIVGMTGDGVNDAPALKQADAGIAVSGATDAARAAADTVLMTPGLSVIIDAIKESRRVFQPMTSYAVYRIAETIRVLLLMTLSILVFNI